MKGEDEPLPLLLGLLRELLRRRDWTPDDVDAAVRCAARGSLPGLAQQAPELLAAAADTLGRNLSAALLDPERLGHWLQQEAHRLLAGDAALYVLAELCAADTKIKERSLDQTSAAIAEWVLSSRQGASLVSYLAGWEGWHEESDRFMVSNGEGKHDPN